MKREIFAYFYRNSIKIELRRCEKHQYQSEWGLWNGEWRNICSLQNQLTISGKLILTSSRNSNSNKISKRTAAAIWTLRNWKNTRREPMGYRKQSLEGAKSRNHKQIRTQILATRRDAKK